MRERSPGGAAARGGAGPGRGPHVRWRQIRIVLLALSDARCCNWHGAARVPPPFTPLIIKQIIQPFSNIYHWFRIGINNSLAARLGVCKTRLSRHVVDHPRHNYVCRSVLDRYIFAEHVLPRLRVAANGARRGAFAYNALIRDIVLLLAVRNCRCGLRPPQRWSAARRGPALTAQLHTLGTSGTNECTSCNYAENEGN